MLQKIKRGTQLRAARLRVGNVALWSMLPVDPFVILRIIRVPGPKKRESTFISPSIL